MHRGDGLFQQFETIAGELYEDAEEKAGGDRGDDVGAEGPLFLLANGERYALDYYRARGDRDEEDDDEPYAAEARGRLEKSAREVVNGGGDHAPPQASRVGLLVDAFQKEGEDAKREDEGEASDGYAPEGLAGKPRVEIVDEGRGLRDGGIEGMEGGLDRREDDGEQREREGDPREPPDVAG